MVDIQNDFADAAGSLSVTGGETIIPAINDAIRSATEAGSLVVATQDWHPESTPHFARDGGIWPVHCVGDTWGAHLHPSLRLPADAPRVRKGTYGEDGYSGFTMRDPVTGAETRTDLEEMLRRKRVERVVICGLATDYCVKATALDAARLGFTVEVAADLIAAVNLNRADGERAVREMAEAGVRIS